jgi:ATP-dependent DNA ligase
LAHECTVWSAVAALPVRSCFIDGEAIVCDDSGLAVFELLAPFATTTPPCSAQSRRQASR